MISSVVTEAPASPGPSTLSIDLLCQVIDNFGDAGICWRLARQLVEELGTPVDLWIDQPGILDPWRSQAPQVAVHDSARLRTEPIRGDLLIAALGAEIPATLRRQLGRQGIAWIRYEYLTAEAWIDGCHGLPSIKPEDGAVEWFFAPGYTPATGGLLRERGLFSRQAAFGGDSRRRWLAAHGLDSEPDRLRVCLFGYAGMPLTRLIEAFCAGRHEADLFMARPLFEALGSPAGRGGVIVRPHEWLDQDAFDRLLWSCDLNLVRGEESWVRAQWAGAPFIWQPYQQEDGAHHVKLEAFLERLLAEAPARPAAAVAAMMRAMSGGDPFDALPAFLESLAETRPIFTRWRAHLAEQKALLPRLAEFMRDQLQLRVSPLSSASNR